MRTGWRYRLASVLGVVLLTVLAVVAANHPVAQHLFTTHVPLFDRLEATVLSGASLHWTIVLSVVAVTASLVPLYRPRPRRILDTVFLAQKRVVVAGLALATLGYFKWSHRLPRATLVMIVGALVVAVPLWFVFIRRRPPTADGRALIVGDDLLQVERVAGAVDAPVLGYLCPTDVGYRTPGVSASMADGGVAIRSGEIDEIEGAIDEHGRLGSLTRLGGLSRLEETLIDYDVDTVLLAFRRPDRAEFFGALERCHDHGVEAKVHRDYADSVLVSSGGVGPLVDVDVEPWDPMDHLFKRAFDVAFSTVGLVVSVPFVVAIVVAIRLEGSGPVLYTQERTAGFGETFPVYKFRTMIPESASTSIGSVERASSTRGPDHASPSAGDVESATTPVEDDENDRITRVGAVLRRTHLDEIPQLWSILVGDMSVVGPRATWTDEEMVLEADVPAWRKRWFVKPGLTGLAQINDVNSTDPTLKLRYDLEYIRRQSFRFDVRIVIRQLWNVFTDVRTRSDRP